MAISIIDFLLDELKKLGIREVFGVPGTHAFPICCAIEKNESLRWIGCCNELNAAYAADGSARIRGIGAVCVTFGVGELAAAAAVAGACAERIPLVVIVGMPPAGGPSPRRILHAHALEPGSDRIYTQMFSPIVAASTILSARHAASEIRRVLACAMAECRPVYIGVPENAARIEIEADGANFFPVHSSEKMLIAAVQHALRLLDHAREPILFPGRLLKRLDLIEQTESMIERTNLAFVSSVMDKGTLREDLMQYLGPAGEAYIASHLRDTLERADLFFYLGTVPDRGGSESEWSFLSCRKEHCIRAGLHEVTIDGIVYSNVELRDFIEELHSLPKRHEFRPQRSWEMPCFPERGVHGYIDCFYRKLEQFLRPGDIFVVDRGTASMAANCMQLPGNTVFLSQMQWGATGWATPAAFGAAVSSPMQRVILLTGEGAHQMSAQELGSFARQSLNPVVFVINNGGYQSGRLQDESPCRACFDVAEWDYSALPQALGCESFFCGSIRDGESLREIFDHLEQNPWQGAYVEVRTGKEDIPLTGESLRKKSVLPHAEAIDGML